MADRQKLVSEIFDLSSTIRYAAVYLGGELSLHEKDGIANSSSGESDKYEELIVNPTILKIAQQRGNIDCGGLDYYVIKYGSFFLLTIPHLEGHISVGIENEGDPIAIAGKVKELVGKYQQP